MSDRTRKNNVRKPRYTQYRTVKPKYTYNDQQIYIRVGYDELGLNHNETHYYSIIIAMINNAYTYRDLSIYYRYRESKYPNYLLPHILPYTAYDVISYIKRVGTNKTMFLNSITNYIQQNNSPISNALKTDPIIHKMAKNIGLFSKK